MMKVKTILVTTLLIILSIVETHGQNNKEFELFFNQEIQSYHDSVKADEFWKELSFLVVATVRYDNSDSSYRFAITHIFSYILLPYIAPNAYATLSDSTKVILRVVNEGTILSQFPSWKQVSCLGWKDISEVAMLIRNQDYTINTASNFIYVTYYNSGNILKERLSTFEKMIEKDPELHLLKQE